MVRKTVPILLILACTSLLDLNGQTRSQQKSQPLQTGSPEAVGLSAERLDRIDAMLQDAVNENSIPGAVALIARHGKIVFHQA